MPVLVTFAYLVNTHRIEWGVIPVLNFVLALVGIVILHAAGNILSDYRDYKSGVDNEKAFAVPNLVFHKFEAREYLIAGLVLLGLGSLIGLAIFADLFFLSPSSNGWGLLAVGVAGVLLSVLYSWLKYRALGDLDIFFEYALLPILGTSYAVTASFVWEALVFAIPVGLITVSVLHANNTRDMETDRAAGIRTLPMLIGAKASYRLYIAYMIIPFVAIALAVVLGGLDWTSLLCLVAVVKAYANIKAANEFKTKGIEAMNMLDLGSSQLQLMFSLSLSLGLVIGSFIG